MVIFGYARVSSRDQNLDRQMDQLRQVVPDERNIITDMQSGKDFDRKGYNTLVGSEQNSPLLRSGDLLVITSLDRLGRNYTEIHAQWARITKEIGADIRVLDMPMLDTSAGDGSLDHRFIADLVLQILAYVSEKERQSIRARQRQGIDAARLRGRRFGRPKIQIPDNYDEIMREWHDGKISAKEAMERTGLKRTSFYRLIKEDYRKYLKNKNSSMDKKRES